jgi:hypothetical protein
MRKRILLIVMMENVRAAARSPCFFGIESLQLAAKSFSWNYCLFVSVWMKE